MRILGHVAAGVVGVVALLIAGLGSGSAEATKSIRIAENDWTGQLIDINLAKIILEEHMNQPVELVFADYTGQWAGLAAGDLDVGMEVWPSFSEDARKEWVDDKKKVEVIGDLGVVGSSGWYVPTYVIKGDPARGIAPMAPDLKTYEQLNKYTGLFARPETGDKGFCLDAVPAWEAHNKERIANLGLNYENIFAGTEGAIMAEIDAAVANGEPILLCHLWAPHWVFVKYDLTEIELPPYSDTCYGYDSGQPATYACDFPEERLYNIARVGFREEFPKAYEFLKNMQLSTVEQQQMMKLVDVDKKSVEEAVRSWMAENEVVWSSWIPK